MAVGLLLAPPLLFWLLSMKILIRLRPPSSLRPFSFPQLFLVHKGFLEVEETAIEIEGVISLAKAETDKGLGWW